MTLNNINFKGKINIEEKAMLADDLSAYIKDKHTQEECIGFIDGYNASLTKLKFLGIADVRNRRELLISFEANRHGPNWKGEYKEKRISDIDEFLKSS